MLSVVVSLQSERAGLAAVLRPAPAMVMEKVDLEEMIGPVVWPGVQPLSQRMNGTAAGYLFWTGRTLAGEAKKLALAGSKGSTPGDCWAAAGRDETSATMAAKRTRRQETAAQCRGFLKDRKVRAGIILTILGEWGAGDAWCAEV
jgi:hypothetical protein